MLDKLYEMQRELDKFILANNVAMGKQESIDKTTLALLVEIGELANTTRCFKHWSKKEGESWDRVLEEFSDVLHFYLSLGNQKGFKLFDVDIPLSPNENKSLTNYFLELYTNTSFMVLNSKSIYINLGIELFSLGFKLGFTLKDIEQGYLIKHKENYQRQKENY